MPVTRLPATDQATDYQVFDSSGTWTKPGGAKRVFVIVVGGGGGGASGRKGASLAARSGGCGGDGGAYSEAWFNAADLAATVTITVGAGGGGGAAVSVALTSGNDGTAGTQSSFGALVLADGGVGGFHGGTGIPANASTYTNYLEPGSTGGVGGGAGGASTAGGEGKNFPGWGSGINPHCSGAGGGGGGGDADNTARNPGRGGAVPLWIGHTGFGTAGSTGLSPTAGGNASTVVDWCGGGGGGGGGGVSGASNAAGANGGTGAIPGGGGGGGGASTGTGNSGAGGTGGNGRVIVVTYF
jgi:hypothetical protein